ncbi:protein of unknown function [Tenacibaculum sp. 190524A02b]|uniref:hypothetical protein n=1 Tax=Tenacibaculum vairaonense TaxID=3137860 RepID=UPI0032B2BFAD
MKTKIKIAIIAMIGISFNVKGQIDSNNDLKIEYKHKIYSGASNLFKFEMIPFGISGHTQFKNYYATGNYKFYVSNGTHGSSDLLGLLIKENGNVGIGTENPSAGLEVFKGNTNNLALLLKSSGAGWGSGLQLHNTSSNNRFGIYSGSDGKWHFTHEGFGDRMTINSNGNIGIGSTNPDAKLRVEGSKSLARFKTEDDGFFEIQATRSTPQSAGTSLKLSSQNHIILDPNAFGTSGNVGIGTESPNSSLTVEGKTNKSLMELKIKNESSTWKDQVKVIGDLNTPYGLAFIGNGHHRGGLYAKNLATGGDGEVTLWSRNNGKIVLDGNEIEVKGNVGIGTPTPSSKLELMTGNDGISLDANDHWIGIGFNRSVKTGQIFDTNKPGWQFTARSDRFSLEGYNGAFSNLLNILKNGNVGIGTTITDSHKLAVAGSIGAREIKVQKFPNWSDFVFENDYYLPTLKEVENHINTKGHLKDIPSAKEVAKNGFYLGEMDAKLLQKIEELTLYTIEQEKQLTSQNKEIQQLKAQNTKIEQLEKENKVLKSLLERVQKLEEKVNKN